MATAICFWVAKITGPATGETVLKGIGLVLLAVAASTSFQCLWPYKFFGFPIGSGGVLGAGAAQLLRSNFAWLGTLILVVATWVVGFLLLADSFVLTLLGCVGFGTRAMVGLVVPAWSVAKRQSAVVNEIWQ
ncbi:unnamed protein product, partial [marine sediment metagenome]